MSENKKCNNCKAATSVSYVLAGKKRLCLECYILDKAEVAAAIEKLPDIAPIDAPLKYESAVANDCFITRRILEFNSPFDDILRYFGESS